MQNGQLDDEYAIRYVQDNRREIKRLAAEKIRWTPYEMEDVIQEAYVAALVALETHEKIGLAFGRCFWGLLVFRLKSLCCTSVRASQIAAGQEAISPAANPFIDTCQYKEQQILQELVRWSVSVMRPRQAQAWRMTLSGKRPSTEAIAGMMNVRRQSVEELQRRGLGRVRRAVVNGGLPPKLAGFLNR